MSLARAAGRPGAFRRSSSRFGRRPTLAAIATFVALYGAAWAQCGYEVEPNDALATATVLTDAGRGLLAPDNRSNVPGLCAAGEVSAGDQDVFRWDASDEDARHRWAVAIEGSVGARLQVELLVVPGAGGGSDGTAPERHPLVITQDGSRAVSNEFLVGPGRHYLSVVSGGGAAGPYVVELTPMSLLRYGAGSDRYDGSPRASYAGEFGLYLPVAGELVQEFTIDGEASRRVWGLELWAAHGSAPKLVLRGPSGVVGESGVDAAGRARLSGLDLVEGTYEARVIGDSGMVRLRLESQGVRSDGTAVEPNDDFARATIFPPGSEMRGTNKGYDFFRIDVTAADARFYDLDFTSEGGLRYTLFDMTDAELLSASPGTPRSGVLLKEGTYQLLVAGSDGAAYSMALKPVAAPRGGEVEPNDSVRTASPLPAGGVVTGRLDDRDVDVYVVRVPGEAQRYRVQLVGPNVSRLEQLGAQGQTLATARGESRLRLDDLLLLPGDNYFRVSGAPGEYALKVLSLGPARLADEAPAGPRADEPLTPAPAGTRGGDAAAAAEALDAAALEPGPPPPPGRLESEPNDDASRAVRVVPGQVYVGRLTGGSDDYYRFFLADDQYVRLEVAPPRGSPPIELSFADFGRVRFPATAGDEVARIERYFLAGNHTFLLKAPAEDDDGYYQLRLTLLGRLDPPVDAEPNDRPETAALVPAELEWRGNVGEFGGDYDYYRLPVFAEDTSVEVTLRETTGKLQVNLSVPGSSLRFETTGDLQAGTPWRATLPAGEQAYLRLGGESRYLITVGFGTPPDPAQLLPPRGPGVVAVTLDSPADELAAFWHEGQALNLTARVQNLGASPQELNLEAASSHAGVELEVAPSLTLGAGETRDVPLRALVPSDLRDDLPLRVEVKAGSPAGSAVAAFETLPACEAVPHAPYAYWPLPSTLLGRFNALRPGFGATIHAPDGWERRDSVLVDGRVGPYYAAYVAVEHSPTFRLAGDGPVTLLGATLDPRSNADPRELLAAFVIETSLDGATFTPAYQGTLKAAGIEQAFVFDAPVSARYARLVFVSNQTGSQQAYLGEWKLIAEGLPSLGEIDLAAPENGGHVVWGEPLQSGYGPGLLVPRDRSGRTVDLRDAGALTFVIGFHDGRAAQVARLEWQEHEEALGKPESMFEAVTVEVSLQGGAGPWEPLADWRLARDASGLATLTLDAPTWARYLRFTAPATTGPGGEVLRYFYPPDEIKVLERPVSDDYLSALGEWGAGSRSAVLEYLEPPTPPGGDDASDNHSRATAKRLQPGTTVTGTVRVAVDEDWYVFTVPPGENFLELRLGGDPTVAYDYELLDPYGRALDYYERADGEDVVVSLYAEPGDYYLHLWEPEHSVVFAWDTSGSVGPYQAIIYNSLASFATDLDGEREAAQLLAFASPRPLWLLPGWSTSPERVQRAITEFGRDVASSNSESALLAATLALAEREGTRAILLITDAESDGAELTPALWRAFEEVRPRVFTFEVSSGGSDYAQDLMQDWADVNGGVYSLAAGVGDFDAGFARASCLLRRPKRYTVSLATRFEALPGPGSLAVRAAPGAAVAAVEVIFDASGSMGKELPSGEQRITAAKRALATLVGEVLPEGTPFALRAFGHVTPTSCESRLDVPFGPLDRAKALAAVEAISPKLLSQTAIADSLLAVPSDLASATGGRTVILITDGEESCGGDPAAAVREAREHGPLDLAIVSLGLEPEAQAVFERLAADVGASYVDVGSYQALADAVSEALEPAFEVYDAASGELVARGRVGGPAVELAMGVYDVRVMVAPMEEFLGVRVPGDTAITLTLGGR